MAELTPTPDAKDVADNKVFAILAYFGILFLIPLLAAKESPFARFHTNQGLILCIAYIAVMIAVIILGAISAILGLISSVLYLGLFVLSILGAISAARGETKELPLIGTFKLIQ
ncbi:MAG: hypothetical protein LBP50_04920 [Tannerella sp.]|jgi:uncharacterized membrane protein|nr:hypothetical protein [Tannerella sp.]